MANTSRNEHRTPQERASAQAEFEARAEGERAYRSNGRRDVLIDVLLDCRNLTAKWSDNR